MTRSGDSALIVRRDHQRQMDWFVGQLVRDGSRSISLACCIRMLYSTVITRGLGVWREEDDMSVLTTVRLEDTVRRRLEARARAHRRSLSDQILIGYLIEKGGVVCLLALGSHENFYRDLQ